MRDLETVMKSISGTDAVLSTLGPARGETDGVMRQGLENLLTAMHAANVKRLLVVVGAGVGDVQDQPGMMDKLINVILKLVSRDFYDEMKNVATMIRKSDLAWTLVRVPRLTDTPGIATLRVGYLGAGLGSQLSREDLAYFMLSELENAAHIQQAPAVSN